MTKFLKILAWYLACHVIHLVLIFRALKNQETSAPVLLHFNESIILTANIFFILFSHQGAFSSNGRFQSHLAREIHTVNCMEP